jgi:hypothetical protein
MNMNQLLIPQDRLTVSESIQIFGEIANYPLEIHLGSDSKLVYQNEVYNLLLMNATFYVDSSLMTALVLYREGERIPEPNGELIVIDCYNCFVKQGEYWYPYRFQFNSENRVPHFFSKGSYSADLEHPIKWNTLLRFLRTFHPHRRKFTLYHSFHPLSNYYTYLKSLYMEFKTIPSNELESLGEGRRARLRVRDELIRRRVLSYRV